MDQTNLKHVRLTKLSPRKLKESMKAVNWGKMKFNYLSIRSRLLIIFSLMIVFMLSIGGASIVMFNQVNTNVEEIIYEDMALVQNYEKTSYLMSQRIANLRGYLLTSEEKYLNSYYQGVGESQTYQTDILALSNNAKIVAIFNNLKELDSYIEENVISLVQNRQRSDAMRNVNTYVNPKADEILAAITAESDAHVTDIQKNGVTLAKNTKRVSTILGISIVLISAIGIVIALLFSNHLANAIKVVMDRLNLITSGKLNHEPLAVQGDGEVVALTKATNAMQTYLIEIINQIKMSSGILTGKSDVLSQSAQEVKDGSEQVAVTMQELAIGTENQAHSATLLATNMDAFRGEIATVMTAGSTANHTSRNIASLSEKGKMLMSASKSQMETINAIVQDATDKMETLDRETKEIGNLVAIIHDVANQTNLLALNAAIEAARAGEHGRGFAVVADEVRKLSERVSESVKDITVFVDNIQTESHQVAISLQTGYEEVKSGLTGVKETSHTFDTIAKSLETVVVNISEINKELNHLAGTGQEMSQAITEIASVSEESAAGVEQTSAASQEINSTMEEVATNAVQIAQQAELLDQIVSRFELDK